MDRYAADLSAIIIKNLPIWAEIKRTPDREIALLEDWEEKIERMAQATMDEDVVILTGVPSWTLVLVKRILELSGKSDLKEVWPNLQLFMHGGVSFKPYRDQFEALISGEMHYIESYNASEGFFGIQDRLHSNDLLLMLDYGIYYEFLPMEELGKTHPNTVSLKDVEVGKNYALVISTNAGLWRYIIGDTVRFTSTSPYRIQVTGRTRHYINVFGEEVIVENAEAAIKAACDATHAQISDYTVGPVYMEGSTTGGHEWLIEFEQDPECLQRFSQTLDESLKEVNTDYSAKRSYDMVLQPPKIHSMPQGTFYNWMKERGKLGGQHKVPRLSNDRAILDQLLGTAVEQ